MFANIPLIGVLLLMLKETLILLETDWGQSGVVGSGDPTSTVVCEGILI